MEPIRDPVWMSHELTVTCARHTQHYAGAERAPYSAPTWTAQRAVEYR